jgi:hypothetical protein
VIDIDDTLGNVLATVLDDCVEHMGMASSETVVENLRQGDESTRRSFRRGLGQEIAKFLGLCDDDVKAVYLYDHDVEAVHADAEWSPHIVHLIVWAQPKTAALNSLVAVLNRALTRAFDDLIGDLLPIHLLDVQLVDDLEVKRRAGYAGLLFSPRFQSLEVWKRESVSHSHALAALPQR